MAHPRLDESTINASLDAYLHGAEKGDVNQARKLHEMLDRILSGREERDGQLWLTDHARMLLAEMHRELSHCEETGHGLEEHVLDAVRLKPRRGQWKDSVNFVNDLRVAIAVAHELCEQTRAGDETDIDAAVRAVEEEGPFKLPATRIRAIYDEVADTVGGFKEISSH
ncbi:MAG: hypothetical protein P8Y54_08045 [Xanthomonadales bacterium]